MWRRRGNRYEETGVRIYSRCNTRVKENMLSDAWEKYAPKTGETKYKIGSNKIDRCE